MKHRLLCLPLALAATLGHPALAIEPPAKVLQGTSAKAGLLPVHVDAGEGRILLSLPKPDASGISGRYLYVSALKTGLGSAPIGLDRSLSAGSRILVFRRVGKKIIAEVENPRFRASTGTPAEQAGVRESFAYSTLWTGDVAAEMADGRLLVDISSFLTRDDPGIGRALKGGGGGEYRLDPALSAADPNDIFAYPDNIEMNARLTFVSAAPNAEVSNIAPVSGNVSFIIRHSLIRLPEPGYQPRRFDPRAGTFGTQVVDFSAPLGQPIVYELANRFRLERETAPDGTVRVKKPIIFHIDPAAPEPIRTALREGVAWWADAFAEAGLPGAFRAEILPDGADPLDIRYNVVNWVNRATRGWSYGQVIDDPRTGEIIKGQVLLGSLRVRQDMLIFQALVGAGLTGTGDPSDPITAALARIRQLAAHEVGHAIGLAHNFAASTQGRYSVMDYPAPRVGLKDGKPDLSDAYGVGVGRWDKFAVAWLYGAQTDAEAAPIMAQGSAEGLRYVSDNDARPIGSGQPYGSLWDDAADPVAELDRMMEVRQAAVERFGPASLPAGDSLASLRRSFVPIWLLHRYQVEAAAKLLGGVDFTYAVNGAGGETAQPVPAAEQRRAMTSLLGTLTPRRLGVPGTLLPNLSAGWSGNGDRQEEIEVMGTAGGPVFDPLTATETAAQVTLAVLLSPDRLNRLEIQRQADPASPGADTLMEALLAQVFDFGGISARDAVVQRRIATTSVLALARAVRDPALSPTIALAAADRLAGLGSRLAATRGEGEQAAWSRGLGRLLGDREALERAITDESRLPKVPPGMPIG
jgi:hypothetical protein